LTDDELAASWRMMSPASSTPVKDSENYASDDRQQLIERREPGYLFTAMLQFGKKLYYQSQIS
jgi:hypothetical protein